MIHDRERERQKQADKEYNIRFQHTDKEIDKEDMIGFKMKSIIIFCK